MLPTVTLSKRFIHSATYRESKSQLSSKFRTKFARNGAMLSYRGLVMNPARNESLSNSIHSSASGLKHSRETNSVSGVEISNTNIVRVSRANKLCANYSSRLFSVIKIFPVGSRNLCSQ